LLDGGCDVGTENNCLFLLFVCLLLCWLVGWFCQEKNSPNGLLKGSNDADDETETAAVNMGQINERKPTRKGEKQTKYINTYIVEQRFLKFTDVDVRMCVLMLLGRWILCVLVCWCVYSVWLCNFLPTKTQ
jgi:hypothetical protein